MNALTHLHRLEAESIDILREAVAESERPVMLYSIGKDSSVMLHLARKAFFPSRPPFPLLHVDTTWKFQEMYAFRDRMAAETGMDLLVHVNPEAQRLGINPFDHGSSLHTDVWKTQGLKQALDQHGFDLAFGGARRDEEKSRAKERVFSFRSAQHRWDPKNQRPELWRLYNARQQSRREHSRLSAVELDRARHLAVHPRRGHSDRSALLRCATPGGRSRRPARSWSTMPASRCGTAKRLILRRVRFRTLGCYPLTGAIESDAEDLNGDHPRDAAGTHESSDRGA